MNTKERGFKSFWETANPKLSNLNLPNLQKTLELT